MEDIVRVGFISTVSPEKGTAQVYYPDRGSTTGQLQLFAFRSEFSPPEVGDQVVVAHLSNDTSSGVILGRFWGEGDPPPGADYRKGFGVGAYEERKGDTFTVHCGEIRLDGDGGSITLSELVSLRERVEALERGNG